MNGSTALQEKLNHWATIFPEKHAIIETNTEKSIRYRDLLHAVLAIKAYLGSKKQIILVALPGGIIDAIVWLAVLTGGHLLIPVSPQLTEYEYEEIISQHMPNIIIAEEKNLFLGKDSKILTPSDIQEIITKKDQRSDVVIEEGSIYLSTSGSTGKPKGIILTASQIVFTAKNICEIHEITENDRGLTPLPFYHVNAPVVSLLTTIFSGSTVIIAPKYSTSHFWEWVEKYDPTWISIVPTMVAMLLSTERPGFLDHASLHFIRTASAPLPVENLKRFEKKFRIAVIETYGITEAASTIAANPRYKHKPGSVGFPIGVNMCIVNPKTGEELQSEDIGEIWIKGDNVIRHYDRNASEESFYHGWFKTGDIGFMDRDGFLYITGRIKDIIIRGGENIAPREIEEVLVSFPSVEEAVVVGQPDPIYGEKIIAFIVMSAEENARTTEKIKSFTQEKLSPQKVPSEIYIIDEFPRGRTGKVNKNSLRNMWQNGNSYVAMR